MRSRRQLIVMNRLADVQHTRRAAAESALARAHAAEAAARSAEEDAAHSAKEAEREWLEYLGTPNFSPEFGQALSAQLLNREGEVEAAALAFQQSSEDRVRREGEWQLQEARLRLQKASISRLSRELERRAD